MSIYVILNIYAAGIAVMSLNQQHCLVKHL
jgi:hypothetical protein